MNRQFKKVWLKEVVDGFKRSELRTRIVTGQINAHTLTDILTYISFRIQWAGDDQEWTYLHECEKPYQYMCLITDGISEVTEPGAPITVYQIKALLKDYFRTTLGDATSTVESYIRYTLYDASEDMPDKEVNQLATQLRMILIEYLLQQLN
jgi:hypothetical protein